MRALTDFAAEPITPDRRAAFEAIVADDTAVARWHWALRESPAGEGTTMLLLHGDDVVGVRAVGQRRVWVGDDIALVGWPTLAAVAAGHRPGHLEAVAAEACRAALAAAGTRFVCGFVDPSAAGAQQHRLGWSIITRPTVHIKALDVGRLVADRLQRPRFAPWLSLASRTASRGPGLVAAARARLTGRLRPQVLACSSFDGWADDLWQRCRDQHRVWVIRDRSYLAWRYERRPDSEYVILRAEAGGVTVGLAVLGVGVREEGRVCFIMELLVDGAIPAARAALLQAIEDQARGHNCAFISVVIPVRSPERAALLRHAYLPMPPRPKLFFGGRPTAAHSAAAFSDADGWGLSWGDTDT